MADSVNARNLPAGFLAYAGYVNGAFPDEPAIAAAHPGAWIGQITVTLANVGNAFDIENGDGTVSQGPAYIVGRTFAGVVAPKLYCARDNAVALYQEVATSGIARSAWRLWTAHYGAGRHICGPTTCGLPVQADGTQWIDHGLWDESLLLPNFFTATTPGPAPAPTTRSTSMATNVPTGGILAIRPDGTVDALEGAQYHGSAGQVNPNLPPGGANAFTPAAPMVGIVPTEDGGGYWMVGEDGGIFAFGNAADYGPGPEHRTQWGLGHGIPAVGIVRGTKPGVAYTILGDGGGPGIGAYDITADGQYAA